METTLDQLAEGEWFHFVPSDGGPVPSTAPLWVRLGTTVSGGVGIIKLAELADPLPPKSLLVVGKPVMLKVRSAEPEMKSDNS